MISRPSWTASRLELPPSWRRLFNVWTARPLLIIAYSVRNVTREGYLAALFYSISYALMAAVAFGLIMLLSRAGVEAEEINDFKGLNQRNPWYAGIMAIAMFSLAGVPPLFGSFANLMVLRAVIDAGQMWLAIVAIVFAIVGLFYHLRIVKVMYFDALVDTARCSNGACGLFRLERMLVTA